MDFDEWFKDHRYSDTPLCYGAAKDAFKAGQQSKQAEIDALQQQNQRLAMRLDVIHGVLQKQIDLIVELKNDT